MLEYKFDITKSTELARAEEEQMQILDNINYKVRDDLKQNIHKGSKMSIAAACFSIYAFQELKKELQVVDEQRMRIQKEIDRLMKLAKNEKQPKKKFELVQKINKLKTRLI